MKRFLVVIHLAAKFEKTEIAARATALLHAMQSLLGQMETVLTSDKAFAFACVSDKTSRELWKSVAESAPLARQDNISVIEVGFDICTTHRGLQAWNGQTDMLAGLAELARKK